MLTFENDVLISRYEELANSIVLQAVNDWRKMCKTLKHRKDFRGVSFTRLEKFFKSDWFILLSHSPETARAIWETLDKERNNIRNEILESRKRELRKETEAIK